MSSNPPHHIAADRGDHRRGPQGSGRTRRVQRRPALTREEVLTAALRIIDQDGMEALSMRRLGHDLDRDPMRLYRYASSKDALLDGVVELVICELTVAEVRDGNWERALRETAHGFRSIAVAHPRVVPLLVTRPLATPLGLRPLGTLRPVENLLDLFIAAGFDESGALHAYRFYFGFLYGHILTELQEAVHDPEETDHVIRLGLYRLPLKQFPRLRSLATALAAYDGAEELDQGLDIVLAGLRRQLNGISGITDV